jgi:UDP-N-acetylmuramyl pentapeptide phosphotransferase/UDP-N-acetylglucosamine-1-phosphate transferase
MIRSLPPYALYLLATALSVIISIYAIRKVIFITKKKNIFDIPDKIRKIHGAEIPSLGGIGIFIGFIIPAVFFMDARWYAIIAASVLLFFTGIYDDIMNMRPSKKLVAQLLASGMAVYFADVRIMSLHGLFGLQELPYWLSAGLTVFLCTFFVNVFNFVDGIDGLACSLAILYTGLLGALFAMMGDVSPAAIAFCLAGATAGLLFFNKAPARIYMGDTGSLLLGFMIFILAVLFLNSFTGELAFLHSFNAAVLFVIALLFLPVYDALRVFILRASKGISPLKADRRHLHYYLLDAGLGHTTAVMVIVAVNIVLLIAAVLLQGFDMWVGLLAVVAISTIAMSIVYGARNKVAANK